MPAMSLLVTAVLTLAQTPPAVPPRIVIPPIPPLDATQLHLAAADARLQALIGLDALAGLDALTGLGALSGLDALAGLEALEGLDLLSPAYGALRTAYAQDPADSLYRAARRYLNRNNYKDAAETFARLRRQYPRSSYVADALYWEAFALYRSGGTDDLRAARERIDEQKGRFPSAATHGDAETLYARIQGELARRGDADAAEWIRTRAAPTQAGPTGTPPTGTPPTGQATARCASEDDDDDPRIAALNALMQMDAENAIPILRRVLARRDPCSVALRRKAMFIVSQKRSPETEDILLGAARNDPDAEVRGNAIFWLSQVNTERAVDMLDSVVRTTTDPEILDKAIFALSQQRSPKASQALRAYAERADASSEGREKAIFWLGQHRSPENAEFLRGLYARLTDQELKEKVIFSLSQMGGAENGRWLMEIALNEREDIEMRKKALFWAGQGRDADITQLVQLYDRIQSQEMKEQLIFVYSQRREAAAVDKLFDIAKNERDRELRKKAIFWLGQSHDPRVPQFLQDLLGNP